MFKFKIYSEHVMGMKKTKQETNFFVDLLFLILTEYQRQDANLI